MLVNPVFHAAGMHLNSNLLPGAKDPLEFSNTSSKRFSDNVLWSADAEQDNACLLYLAGSLYSSQCRHQQQHYGPSGGFGYRKALQACTYRSQQNAIYSHQVALRPSCLTTFNITH